MEEKNAGTDIAVQGKSTPLAVQEEEITDLAQLSDITPSAQKPQEQGALEGLHGLNPDEIRLPRLAIAQGLSKAMVPGESDYIEGLKLFELYNDRTKQIYGNGPLLVVPVKWNVKYIEFDPEDRNIVLDRDVPAGDPRTRWDRSVTPNQKPRATEFVEVVCLALVPGNMPEPLVVSIKTTNRWNRRAADDFKLYIEMRGVSIYKGLYRITSRSEKNDEGIFGVFGVKNAGFIPDTPTGRALLRMAKDFYDSLADKTIVLDREPGSEDGSFDPKVIEAQAQPNKALEM